MAQRDSRRKQKRQREAVENWKREFYEKSHPDRETQQDRVQQRRAVEPDDRGEQRDRQHRGNGKIGCRETRVRENRRQRRDQRQRDQGRPIAEFAARPEENAGEQRDQENQIAATRADEVLEVVAAGK